MFYKYLLSFVLVLLLPIGLLGYYGKLQVSGLIQHYVDKSNQDMLNQLKESVDARLLEMNQIAARIAGNPNLTPYAVTKDAYSAYLTKPLLDYKISNDFIHELLYYVRGEPLLYSSVSTYRLSSFINDIYQYKNWTESAFRRDLDTMVKPILRTAEEVTFMSAAKESLVSYLLPLPLGSQHPYGTVLFLIKEASLLGYLKNEELGRSGNTIIFDERGRIVTYSKGEQGLDKEMLQQQLAPDGEIFSIASLGGSRYYVNRLKSELTGWSYVTVSPIEAVMQPIRQALVQWLRILVAILLLGGAVILILMKVNYEPIRALLASHRELGLKVERSRSALREHLLMGLLRGEIGSREELEEREGEAGLRFPYSSFVVLLAEIPEDDPAWRTLVTAQMTASGEEGLVVYGKESMDSGRIGFVACTSLPEETFARWLKQTHERLHVEAGRKTITVGVGRFYEQLDQIGRSFIEASTAIDYKLIRGAGEVIPFRDIATGQAYRYSDNTQQMEQVGYLFREGKTEQLIQVLQQIAERINRGGTPLFAARFLCYDIIHAVAKAVESLKQEFPELTERFPDVMTLMEFHTVEELVQRISDSCIELCKAIEQHQRRPAERQLAEMLAYLQTHYADSSFSVQRLAEHLSLSTSYISRMFKEHTGQTILEYMHAIRIAEAKRLLAETDAPVKEIVASVGYYDTSSFIRKFKFAVGVTPGEYRKTARMEAGSR